MFFQHCYAVSSSDNRLLQIATVWRYITCNEKGMYLVAFIISLSFPNMQFWLSLTSLLDCHFSSITLTEIKQRNHSVYH